MTLLLLAHFVAAAVAPGLARMIHRRSFLVLATVPAATFAWLVAQSGRVADGGVVVEHISWVPQLGMDFDLRLGALQWLLGLLVSGVGALALVSELVYGAPPSFADPARFSFAHGGKDGYPFPVDKPTYEHSIDFLKTCIDKAKMGDREKLDTFKRLAKI